MSGRSVRVGVDIGGTGTRVVALDPGHRVLARTALPTPRAALAPDEAVAFLREAVLAVVPPGAVLDGVGIGASGPVLADGVIDNPHTLPAFSGAALGPVLGDALGVRCAVGSDAVAAALAESAVGAGRGAPDLLHVTLGTGIGVAVVRDGVPLLGGDGLAPEGGHLDVPDDAGVPCYCGRARCWEQTSSRRALQRRAGVEDVAGLDVLAAAALDGDEGAATVFHAYGTSLGLGLRTLVQVLRPSRIVLGGGGARFAEVYRTALLAALDRVERHGLGIDLTVTELDDDGGAIGAALLLDAGAR